MTYEIPVTRTQNPKIRPADESKLGLQNTSPIICSSWNMTKARGGIPGV